MVPAGVLVQRSLLDDGSVVPDTTFGARRRVELGAGAWLDAVPAWLGGSDTLFETLLTGCRWVPPAPSGYEPRLVRPGLRAVGLRLDDDSPVGVALAPVAAAIADRYQVRIRSAAATLLRAGREGIPWHGHRRVRRLPAATVAVVSLGAPRRFLLRPRAGGRSARFDVGRGDLLVMGGTCQRTWLHALPTVRQAGSRIDVTFLGVEAGRQAS